jgi:hypothetical protein
MATAIGTPALKPTVNTSSTASGAGSLDADPISRVAIARMAGTSSSSGTALTGDASADYDFQKNLEAAESKLLEGKNDTALQIFSEIQGRIKKAKLPETSFFPLRCFLGLADCSPPADRVRYSTLAYCTLIKVYALRDWYAADISSTHAELRWHLKKLRPLIPETESSILAQIDEMIAECANHILPIDAFNEKVKEADEAFKTNKITTRVLYTEALALIADKLQIEFEVARGVCLLKLTKTYQINDPDRAQVRDRAQEAIFSLFDKSASLYETGKYTRVDAFRLLIGYLRVLRFLTSDIVNHQEIQAKIDACKLEIPEELLKSVTFAPDPH